LKLPGSLQAMVLRACGTERLQWEDKWILFRESLQEPESACACRSSTARLDLQSAKRKLGAEWKTNLPR